MAAKRQKTMKKLESTLKNMMLSLTCITIVAGAALAGVNMLTEETINAQKEAKKKEAISAVLPKNYDHIGAAEKKAFRDVLPAQEIDPTKNDSFVIYRAYDANDQFVGAAVQAHKNGFGGVIKLMIGFDAENKIVDYVVLEQTETPGLGTHIVEWFKNEDKPNQNIKGRKADGKMTVNKDGGDVDAITAATISSRAFLGIINRAYAALNDHDAYTGASKQHHPAPEAEEAVEDEAKDEVEVNENVKPE